ncbi:MAG: hypothetical protein JF886_09385 [Candidatus Dormibacteraeota bacterium]|uniref:Uncharacterized protein n=1 Tax=Candidatus Aeolococcus gillhamiae TaxID=3127015 RepID=A0A934MZT3_9BACT|nr:hypothetical protein [Candidatus Dormibacteraeota bacterium]
MRRDARRAENWVAVSPEGAWYWDGSGWRTTLAGPWRAPIPTPAGYPLASPPGRSSYGTGARGRALRVLLLPLVLVVEILARGLGRALSMVVGILSWGVTIALIVWLFHH